MDQNTNLNTDFDISQEMNRENREMNRRIFVFIAAIFLTTSLPALALYDLKPDPMFAAIQGEWRGTLAYRDYREPANSAASASAAGAVKPDNMVTLATTLFVALAAPNALTLHYVFDDGPGKTVYSYERMSFDLEKNQLSWGSGAADKPATLYRITANVMEQNRRKLLFERAEGDGIHRYSLLINATSFSLEKNEFDAKGAARLRNRYQFVRPGI